MPSTRDPSSSGPTLPIAYVHLTLDQAQARGVRREALLRDLDIPRDLLSQADARMSFFQYGRVVARALRLTNDPGLGYEFGLRASLITHAHVGFGVMSQGTLRKALAFGGKYLGPLRSPGFTGRFFLDGEQAVVEIREGVQFGPLRQYALDVGIVGFMQLVRPFVPDTEIELWFECDEPPHYARYRDRLPRVRFAMGANQIRFPIARLDRPIDSANPITAELLKRECEREMAVVGHDDRTLSRVRALLARKHGLDLATVAKKVSMSERTLKRRLRAQGFSFRELVDEVRREHALRLLRDTKLSVEAIGERVGYTAHANFIRAFRRWTSQTPSEARASLRAQSGASGAAR